MDIEAEILGDGEKCLFAGSQFKNAIKMLGLKYAMNFDSPPSNASNAPLRSVLSWDRNLLAPALEAAKKEFLFLSLIH
jgi:hypothetical protein